MSLVVVSLLSNPTIWAAVALLVALCGAALWLRLRFGRRAVVLMLGDAWFVLTLVAQLADPQHIFDGRFWLHYGSTVAAAIAPVLFVAVLIRDRTPRWLVISGGIVAVTAGTVAFPVVGLLTACTLGIDCL